MLLKGSLVDPNPYVKRFQMKNAPLATMHTTAFAAQRAAAGASHTTEAPFYSCLRPSEKCSTVIFVLKDRGKTMGRQQEVQEVEV